jgi:hypothetical protein
MNANYTAISKLESNFFYVTNIQGIKLGVFGRILALVRKE